MKVIGIAAPATTEGVPGYYFDPVRLPEYFMLHQQEGDSIVFKGKVRWDTVTPQYSFENISAAFGNWAFNVVPLYEAYFDKPIIVHDTFYVGSTVYNNLRYGYDPETGEYVGKMGHVLTVLFNYRPTQGPPFPNYAIPPDPYYFIYKFLYPTGYEHPLPTSPVIYDTSQIYL